MNTLMRRTLVTAANALKVNCIYYIEEKTCGRCGKWPPPNEDRLFMYLTCKLVGREKEAWCPDQEDK
jgi:hypothetical protein